MDWIDIKSEEDVKKLMDRVEGFHDWYVADFSYDPLALSEDDDLNLGSFKIDIDALTVTFRWERVAFIIPASFVTRINCFRLVFSCPFWMSIHGFCI